MLPLNALKGGDDLFLRRRLQCDYIAVIHLRSIGDDQDSLQRLARSGGRARVTFADRLDILLPNEYITEDRMLVIEVRSGHGRNKELAAVGAGTGIRHRQQTRTIESQETDGLVAELVSRSAAAGRRGVAALHHEIGDDPMECSVVVVALLREEDEIVDRHRRQGFVEIDIDWRPPSCRR